jgi:hypothetical protein
MMSSSPRRRLGPEARRAAALEAARTPVADQDAVWSKYSNDKVDIGQVLTSVLQGLARTRPPRARLRGLSVGSSTEPQFRILQPACPAGLHLLDIDPTALARVETRVARQHIDNVTTIEADFTDALGDRQLARQLRRQALDGAKVGLVTFHHSLYYAPRATWDDVVDAVWHELLSPQPGSAAVHAVLMAHRSDSPTSTTAIYNRWAGQFFGAYNDQDLAGFARSLRRSKRLPGSSVRVQTSEVVFDNDDFTDFMRCVWMILLHPQVHDFDRDQQIEVGEWIYANLWSVGVQLTQRQDHVVITR